MKLKDKWIEIVTKANSMGIPLPTVRDPKTGAGSVSLTMLAISCVLVIIGLIGKWSGKLGIVDIDNSLQFFYASSALYFGRNFSAKSKVAADLEVEPTEPK